MSDEATLFDRFGGTRAMADHLGEAPSTVQSWKAAGRIPAGKQPAVLERGRELGIEITAEDVVYPLGVALCAAPDCPNRPGSAEAHACDRTDCGLAQRKAA